MAGGDAAPEVPAGTTARSATRCAKRCTSQPYLEASRPISSAMARSVPCRRSTNGETTAIRKLTHPAVAAGGDNGRLRRGEFGREPQVGKAEENSEEQPQVGIHHEIFVGLDPGKHIQKQK